MAKPTILITGGAGYIGSHAVLAFRDGGTPVVVLDDLSTGRRAAVAGDVPFIQGDVGDGKLVKTVIRDHKIAAVMHFAGSIVVPESVSDPLKYYRNNSCASRTLIEACVKGGVKRFIFSSTAAVYGIPEKVPVAEESPLQPINPYGTSKLVMEWMLRDTALAHDFAYAALRYFNVAGADPKGRSGQATKSPTHLIEISTLVAAGMRDHLTIFGDDFDTPDGTCIRDYIHVTDLAEAHVLALRYLEGGGTSGAFNLGNQRGFSVREVADAVRRVTGREFEVRMGPRRPGDPGALVADATAARTAFGWTPKHADLDSQIGDAWRWQQSQAKRPRSS
jgi:UDP-glucose 4-epimerase